MTPMVESPAALSLTPLFAGFSGCLAGGISAARLEALFGPDPSARLAAGPPFEFVARVYDKGSWVYRFTADLGEGPAPYYVKLVRQAEVWQVMRQRMFSRRGLRRPFHYPKKFLRLRAAPPESAVSWRAAEILAERGIATPRLAAALCRGAGRRREELMVSRAVADLSAPDLKAYLIREFGPHSPAKDLAAKRRLLEALARFLARLLEAPLHFPDLKLHNFLVRTGRDGGYELFFLDLNEAEAAKPPDETIIVLDRLNRSMPFTDVLTATDRLRFLQAFLAARGGGAGWREVSRAVTRRGRAQMKRGKHFRPSAGPESGPAAE